MLIIVGASTAVWLAATYLTQPTPMEQLRKFHERVRPGGRGWGPVEREFNLSASAGAGRSLIGVVSGAVFIYSSLFALGKVLLGSPLGVL